MTTEPRSTPPVGAPTARQRLDRLLAGQLPLPGRTRFQPLRMGLIGVWQYEEEVFVFHDGRLILTGRNGAGKSKVIEVSSPFLLDANLSAHRLDPFGTSGRTMRDNLLYDGLSQRVGYIWCEYGRITDTGACEYLTIGAGLKATEAKKGAPDSWYFATPQRVGGDFRLYNGRRQPHSAAALKDLLGSNAVFDSADLYQKHISKHLFGFGSVTQLRSLINLLLTLRRPKLSEGFNVDKLTGLLTDGLPPVSHAMLEDLARRFDELARERDEMQRHLDNRAALQRFRAVYHRYARTMVANSARTMTATHAAHTDATARHTAARRALETLGGHLEALTRRQGDLEAQRARRSARVQALEQRPEVDQGRVLDMLGQKAQTARQNADAADKRHHAARVASTEAREDWTREQQGLAAAVETVTQVEDHAQLLARTTGMTDEHDRQRIALRNTPAQAAATLEAVCDNRQYHLNQTMPLIGDVETATSHYTAAADHHDRLTKRRDHALEQTDNCRSAHRKAADLLHEELTAWTDKLTELELSDQQITALHTTIDTLTADGSTPALRTVVDQAARPQEISLEGQRAERHAHRNHLGKQHERLQADRTRIAQEADPEPPAPVTARRPRPSPDHGAPLWQLVDFTADSPRSTRPHLEAALQAAGILDAWVTPRGELLAADTLDTVLVAGPALPGPTLSAVLTATPHPHVAQDTVQQILDSIALHPAGAAPDTTPAADTWIGTDGSWRIGPLQGRTRAEHASYIGIEARKAERLRRLARIDDQLHTLDQQIAAADQAHTDTLRRLDRIFDEKDRLPPSQPVTTALTDLATAERRVGQIETDLTHAQERLNTCLLETEEADRALASYARTHRTATSRGGLNEQSEALRRYRNALTRLSAAAEQLLQRQDADGKARRHHDQRAAELKLREREHHDAETAAQGAETEHRTAAASAGPDVQTVLANLERARVELKDTEAAQKTLHEDKVDTSNQHGIAQGSLNSTYDDVTRAQAAHDTARSAFRLLDSLGLFHLADLPAPPPEPDTTPETRAAHAHQHLSHLTGRDTDQDHAQTELHKAFTRLENEVTGTDWRCALETRDTVQYACVFHNNVPFGVLDTLQTMDLEIDTRRTLIDEEERNLFAEVLLGRIGNHLSQRRAEAKSLIERMNRLLADRPTATNLLMRLRWCPDPEQNPDVHNAIHALDGRHTRNLADTDRDRLIDFLAARVSAARDHDGSGDWKTHLAQALDYRRWSRFTIEYKKDGQHAWTELTDKKHQKGSGGEKAVMLQLPLFIAAAAHYRAARPHAPRPVYLDEAFAGIDAEMRGDCMGLLADLDLDVIMASHDETGFHPQVPAVATYQLYRDPQIKGVLATPLLWDGAEQREYELTDPALYTDGTDDVLFADDDLYDQLPHAPFESEDDANGDDPA
ncbi:TIGR02680 family protein [Streptomyces sp. NPDC005386]|uniref:TIGR02680 family protein n=1 Tax=Streptomyces sp. NPDC005386 TaxID=3154562 RepID=UPI0033A0662C